MMPVNFKLAVFNLADPWHLRTTLLFLRFSQHTVAPGDRKAASFPFKLFKV